jgi:hypothetical protein
MTMANPTVAQTLPVTVAAADASGAAVDLVAFPTALTSPVYTSDNAAAVLTPSGNDVTVGLPAAGTVNLTFTGVNVAGTSVTATLAIVFDAVVPTVVTVTLTAGTPA